MLLSHCGPVFSNTTTLFPKLKRFGDSFEEGIEFEQEDGVIEIEEMAEQAALQEASLNAVAVKLPPFWSDDPKARFNRVDAVFRLQKVTVEATKFDHVVAVLPHEFHKSARAAIDQPDPDNPFTVLKEALLERFQKHPIKEILDLFDQIQTPGELTNAQLEDAIEGLSREPGMFQKALFVRGVLPAIRGNVLDKFKAGATLRQARNTADSLQEQMVGVTVSAVYNRGQSLRSSQARSQGSLRGSSSGSRSTIPWCRHLKKFGLKAYACIKPCGFIPRANTNALTYEPEKEMSGNEEAYH